MYLRQHEVGGYEGDEGRVAYKSRITLFAVRNDMYPDYDPCIEIRVTLLESEQTAWAFLSNDAIDQLISGLLETRYRSQQGEGR